MTVKFDDFKLKRWIHVWPDESGEQVNSILGILQANKSLFLGIDLFYFFKFAP